MSCESSQPESDGKDSESAAAPAKRGSKSKRTGKPATAAKEARAKQAATAAVRGGRKSTPIKAAKKPVSKKPARRTTSKTEPAGDAVGPANLGALSRTRIARALVDRYRRR